MGVYERQGRVREGERDGGKGGHGSTSLRLEQPKANGPPQRTTSTDHLNGPSQRTYLRVLRGDEVTSRNDIGGPWLTRVERRTLLLAGRWVVDHVKGW